MFKCEVCGKMSRVPVRVVSEIREKVYAVESKLGKFPRQVTGTEIAKEMNLCPTCADEPQFEKPKQPDRFDCNCCNNSTCPGNFTCHGPRYNPKRVILYPGCISKYIKPKSSVQLGIAALEHVESMVACFKQLPFQVKLSDYVA